MDEDKDAKLLLEKTKILYTIRSHCGQRPKPNTYQSMLEVFVRRNSIPKFGISILGGVYIL